MTTRLYYTAPRDQIFNEVKNACIETWKEVGSHPLYIKEKVDYVSQVNNISDNVMTIVALFDENNMQILAEKLGDEARQAIRARMVDGGHPSFLIPF